MSAFASGTADAPLYPPRVKAPSVPLHFPLSLIEIVRNPLSAWPEAIYDSDLVARDDRFGVYVWVTDPLLVKQVLLDDRDKFPKTVLERRVLGPLLGNGVFTSDGADWKWQRQVVAPLFRHADILAFVPMMTAAADGAVARWLSGPPGRQQAIDHDMTAVTFKIIADTLLPGGDSFLAEAIERAHEDYLQPISWEIAYAMLRLPRWIPHPGTFSMRRSERALRGAVAALISARRRKPLERDDLFGRLLKARHPETGEPMSDDLLIDNLLTFLAAGHATTAMALTWTLYLLARSPEWTGRLEAEIASVVGAGPLGADHIDRLTETQMVLKEALRLYPPAPVVMRVAAEDVQLGAHLVRKGTVMLVPIYAIHRHKRLWRDPDRFDPTRFTAAAEETRTRYTFMPFGAGPRICIGMSFAMIEATAVLATFLKSVRFGHVAGCDPEPISRLTLRPRDGMRLVVMPR